MRRLSAIVAVALLVTVIAPAGSASAAAPNHLRLTRTGAGVSSSVVRDGLLVSTELSASLEASSDVETGPLLWLVQVAYAPDETGEYNTFVWSVEGQTSDFGLSIDQQLASAAVRAPAFPVTRCDASGSCVEGVADLEASFIAVGPTQHSHQRAIGSISRQSLFVYNNVGTYRFATATVTLDGVSFGPSTGPSDANIYDTKTGTIDVTRASAGERARPAGIVVYNTGPPPTGRQTGESVFADWVQESGGIGRNTVLSASSQRISSQGTVINQKNVAYIDQVYAIDESGYTTPISETFSLEGGTATAIAVDRNMTGGTVVGASIPAISCTYIDSEPLCIETVVQAAGQWTGVGASTKTRDGSTSGVAGLLVIVYHNSSTHRAATATATVDGVTFSGAVEAWLDRATTGFHEVHIGP